ncbi:MAG TPA: hypothetical protein VEY09_17835 [Pyrinomonadaceae bacterium]|nr:hypothetical protein [Pyrinomonadaceae bacterium]
MTARHLLTRLSLTLLAGMLALPLALSPAPSTVAAQSPPAGTARPTERVSEEEKEKARKELERRAHVLLDEVLRAAQALKLEENRAVVNREAAELLWDHDEKRARALFREAVLAFAALTSGEGSSRRNNPFFWMLQQLRPQTLQAVAVRDPQFALELLRESRPPAEPGEAGAEADARLRSQELAMEQAIAALVAERDPQAALKMAEESLREGVTFGVLTTLGRLRHKDSEAATRLAVEIIRKLQGTDLNTEGEAGMVALALLRGLLLPDASGQQDVFRARATGRQPEKPKPLAVSDEAVRDLAELVAAAALKATYNRPWMLTQIQGLLPELEKKVPARAAQLRLRAAEMEGELDPRERAWMQFEAVATGPSAEAALEAAAKAPQEMRGAFYSVAVANLLRVGDAERARQVAATHLRGEEREQALSQIEQFSVTKAVEQGKVEEARRLITGIRRKEQRAVALARLALALAAKGERKAALPLLEEARGLLPRRPDSEREIEALLEVARGFALVEPVRTFEMLDPLIDQANDMLSAAALLDKFTPGQGMFRRGEMLMYPGLNNIGGPYARYVEALAELARVDFERTRASADRFQRDDVRLLARLLIARSVLLRGGLETPDGQLVGAGVLQVGY